MLESEGTRVVRENDACIRAESPNLLTLFCSMVIFEHLKSCSWQHAAPKILKDKTTAQAHHLHFTEFPLQLGGIPYAGRGSLRFKGLRKD